MTYAGHAAALWTGTISKFTQIGTIMVTEKQSEYVVVTVATRKSDGLTRIHVYGGPADKPWTQSQAKKESREILRTTDELDYDDDWFSEAFVRKVLREGTDYDAKDSNSYWPLDATSNKGI